MGWMMSEVELTTPLTNQPARQPAKSGLTDAALLERLAAGHRVALAEIARRHGPVVHAAARRQAGGDIHLADDITQAVFLTLCRRAGTLRKGTILVGWLFTTTRNIAMTARRAAMRRDRHERNVALVARHCGDGLSEADAMLPLLDEALHALPARDREAVLLRYFNKLAFAEVGERIGTTEEGARKRVTRAVDRLRDGFARRGITTATSAAVATMMTVEAAQASVPAATMTAISTGTVTASATALATTASASTAGVVLGVPIAKVAATVAGLALAGGTTTAIVVLARQPEPSGHADHPVAPVDPHEVAPATTTAANPKAYPADLVAQPWFGAFERVYSTNGRVLNHVHPPFIPERLDFYRFTNRDQADAMPGGPSYMLLGRRFENRGMSYGGPDHSAGLGELLEDFCHLQPHEFVVPRTYPARADMGGDWIGDFDAPLDDKLNAICAQLLEDTDIAVTFVKEQHTSDALVITASEPVEPMGGPSTKLDVTGMPSVPSTGGAGGVDHLLRSFSRSSRWPILDERPSGQRSQDFRLVQFNHSSKAKPFEKGQAAPRAEMEAFAELLSKTLKLSYKIEQRTYTRYVLMPVEAAALPPQ